VCGNSTSFHPLQSGEQRREGNSVIKRFVLAGVLAAAMVTPALATDAVLQVPHTQAQFTVTHLALSRVHGQIPLISGTATFNDAGLPTASSATFDMKNVNSNDVNRDNSLRQDYLETDKFPTMTFVEKKIEGTPAAFKMTGDLTLHGITKSVVLTGKVVNTLVTKGKRNFAYSATTTIDRRDFGIVFAKMLDNQLLAGYPVEIDIDTDAAEK
jgi:polyisoprenoid-binding protein YceI